MSLLSSVLIPMLEKHLISLEPLVAHFLLNELQILGTEVMNWMETKGKVAADVFPKNDVAQ